MFLSSRQRSARRRLRRVLWSGAALLLAGAVAIVMVDGVRRRAHLLALKATGQLPELGWRDMVPMLEPGGRIALAPLIASRNPFASIRNPYRSGADTARGATAFRERCGSCHGADARGGTAPALVGRSLAVGGSDWALYRTLSRGLPGTGMPALESDDRTRWQIIAYVQARRVARNGAGEAAATTVPDGRTIPPVTFAQLVQARGTPADWLTYSGAYDGWRHSTLSEITRNNVHRLRLLWIYQFEDLGSRLETSPIAVNGVLFVTSGWNQVYALDGATGAVLWTYERPLPPTLAFCCGRVNRGLAILDSTLYLATLDARLVALEARTGAVRWEVPVASPSEVFSLTAAPLAVKDLIVVGTAGGEFASRGYIDAYDARTGARRWRFYTIPARNEPGNETWSGDSWELGGGPAWLTGSYDPELDLIYWGIGNPNPDFNGDERLGDNLYTNSVVALEPGSGALRWYFQFTPHDEHDWDAAQIPVLVNSTGRDARKLLLWANRNGFFYVLDRSTGEFLRGRPFAKINWASGLDSAGRPVLLPGARPSREGTLVYPGVTGATNWWSPSYSPRTKTLYVPTLNQAELIFRGRDQENRPGSLRFGGSSTVARENDGQLSIRALDAETGAVRWDHPVVDAPGTASQIRAGGVLSTAGDVVFGGGGDWVVALDARDGRRLWTFRAGYGVHAAPITYLVGNRQRVTIAAGRALLTFGLDETGLRP